MHIAELVATGFRYPTPGDHPTLPPASGAESRGAARQHMEAFTTAMAELTLTEREELHTTTLDLSPTFAPYVGHVTWGDNYRRGEFMATLTREYRSVGVDTAGELPDHLEPVLRYLAVVDEPLADLVDVLPGALSTMRQTLADAAPDNPYLHLVDAAIAVAADLRPLTIRVGR